MERALKTQRPWLSLVRLVHPFPSLLVAAITLAIVPLADAGANASIYVQLGLGMLCYQFAIGVVNDVVDAEEDRRVKPWKAIPAGAISSRGAGLIAAALVAAGLVITSGLGTTAWLIGLAGLACGLTYDLGLKRTVLSWLPYAIAFPLVPIWAFVAVEAWDPWLWWTLPFGAALGLALHLANQAPDEEAAPGQSSGVLALIGQKSASVASVVIFVVVAFVAAALLLGREPWLGVVAFAAGVVVLVLSQTAPRRFGRDGLFGLLAIGAGMLAVTFLAAT